MWNGSSPHRVEVGLVVRQEQGNASAPEHEGVQRAMPRDRIVHKPAKSHAIRQRARGDELLKFLALIAITGDPNRFISAGRSVLAQISWFDPGNVFFPAWGVRVDQAIWELVP